MYFLTLLMLLLPISANAQEIAPVDEGFICMDATTRAEEKHQIQKYLLTSISTVETGKWNKTAQQKMAWPWTINVRGKGHYYKTKEAAVAAAKALRKRGINNFDVGCMQINMRFHGKEFASLEDAFDPEKNVEYAARFLKRLYDRRQDWMKAATDYHSRRPAKAQAYKKDCWHRSRPSKKATGLIWPCMRPKNRRRKKNCLPRVPKNRKPSAAG